MTLVRALRRRTVVRPAARRLRVGPMALAIAALVAACGGTAPSSPAVSGSLAPGGSGSTAPSGSAAATPRPTAWPGNAVIGIEALGVADGEIRKGIADFGRGVETEDLALMRRAADGLAGVDVLVANADRIDIFPPMQPLAAELRATLPEIASASRALRAAIDEGDAEAIGTESARLADALTRYARVQPTIGQFVMESIEQRRLFLR